MWIDSVCVAGAVAPLPACGQLLGLGDLSGMLPKRMQLDDGAVERDDTCIPFTEDFLNCFVNLHSSFVLSVL